MRIAIATLILLTLAPSLMAQRKEMAQARTYIKSGKDLDKAEKLMTQLLANDSASRQNVKVHQTLINAIKAQYEAANEKLYLKEKYDTASFFALTHRLFAAMETLDSVDTPSGRGWKKAMRRRHDNAEYLDALRPNLYYGGTYNLNHGKHAEAYTFFDAYIDCARQPLFSNYNYRETDTLLPQAAYWATLCGYKTAQPDKTLRHSALALTQKARRKTVLRLMANAYAQSGDTKRHAKTLQQGFDEYPTEPYFFTKLTDRLNNRGQTDSALHLANRALQADPHSQMALFAKSAALLNLGRYDECLAASDSLIAINDTLPQPYLNAGMASLNSAVQLESRPDAKQRRDEIHRRYETARHYLELYRRMMPNDKDKWAPALYRVYLNLNMGKQFEEIDGIISE